MYILNTSPDMFIKLSKWGESLGLRIPKKYLDLLKAKEGDYVKVKIQGDELTLQPSRSNNNLEKLSREINLNELIDHISEDQLHDYYDDEPVGREVW